MSTADRLTWRTSSRSSNGEKCVEVAPVADGVAIRHSKHPAAGTITFPHAAWIAFLREAHDGRTGSNGVATIIQAGTDTIVRSLHTGIELVFDQDEWAAFVAGAADGEFDFTDQLVAAPVGSQI